MRHLSAMQLAKALAMPFPTLDDWIRRGKVTPCVPARGTGTVRVFALPECLAIAVARGLRGCGLGMDVCQNALAYIAGLTEDDLQSAIDEGRTLLLAIGPIVAERLFAADEIRTAAPIQAIRSSGAPIIVVDIARSWEGIVKACEAFQRKEATTAETN